jgi:hypothetical protein
LVARKPLRLVPLAPGSLRFHVALACKAWQVSSAAPTWRSACTLLDAHLDLLARVDGFLTLALLQVELVERHAPARIIGWCLQTLLPLLQAQNLAVVLLLSLEERTLRGLLWILGVRCGNQDEHRHRD